MVNLSRLLAQNDNEKKFNNSLKLYKSIMDNRNLINEEFKRNYYNFYLKAGRTVYHYNTDAYNKYFTILNDFISKGNAETSDLIQVISELKTVSNRNDFSFATKLLHTVNPDIPIYDSKVRKYLSKVTPKVLNASNPKNEEKIEEQWRKLTSWYKDFMDKDEGISWITWFDKTFPEYKNINNVKKIDFIMFVFSDDLI